MTGQVFPRFLGVDGSADFVWELASGRWTWGKDPREAAAKQRTFTPERYIEKYGRPIGLDETIDRKAEADEDPADLVKAYDPGPAKLDPNCWPVPAPVPTERVRGEDPETTGQRQALITLLRVLDGWIEACQGNHEALDHRGENRGEECWRSFAPSDIRNMVSDAARELDLPAFADREQAQEDLEEGRV